MTTSANDRDGGHRPGDRVVDVRFEDDRLSVDLADGRTITAPVEWYPRLAHASTRQRANWHVSGAGFGIHWPDVDEDLSVRGLLEGEQAPAAGTRDR